MNADLTLRQKILLAAVDLSTSDGAAFGSDALTRRAHARFPESFSLGGEGPPMADNNKVLAKLSGVDGLCGLGWLEASPPPRTFRVTRKGQAVAKKLQYLVTDGASVSAEVDEAVEAPAAAPKAARARKAEPKKSAPPIPVVELAAQDVHAIATLARSEALRKFLRGSPLTFADALAFWGLSPKRPREVNAHLAATGGLLERVACVFDGGGPFDPKLPALSTCYGLLNLHKLMLGRFAKELEAARAQEASRG